MVLYRADDPKANGPVPDELPGAESPCAEWPEAESPEAESPCASRTAGGKLVHSCRWVRAPVKPGPAGGTLCATLSTGTSALIASRLRHPTLSSTPEPIHLGLQRFISNCSLSLLTSHDTIPNIPSIP